MNYIYKNKRKRKKKERKNPPITPFFFLAFNRKTKKQKIFCFFHLLSEGHICKVNYEIDVELAHPTDIFWNTNAIFEKIEDEELSLQIAYAVNTVYKERITVKMYSSGTSFLYL